MFKFIAEFLGVLSPAYFTVFNLTRSKTRVGEDQFGNVYYQGKPMQGYAYPRRWVIYNGAPEATKVPPEWHGWLHHQSNDVPSENNMPRRKWQKSHTPNLTGTTSAYRPPGHILEGGQRDKATGDYEAWKPE